MEYTAYSPLMQACAAEGILCVLVEMPFNLAVLDVDAAEGIRERYPEIREWYIGGHSLGGSMAASYLAENSDDYAISQNWSLKEAVMPGLVCTENRKATELLRSPLRNRLQ